MTTSLRPTKVTAARLRTAASSNRPVHLTVSKVSRPTGIPKHRISSITIASEQSSISRTISGLERGQRLPPTQGLSLKSSYANQQEVILGSRLFLSPPFARGLLWFLLIHPK